MGTSLSIAGQHSHGFIEFEFDTIYEFIRIQVSLAHSNKDLFMDIRVSVGNEKQVDPEFPSSNPKCGNLIGPRKNQNVNFNCPGSGLAGKYVIVQKEVAPDTDKVIRMACIQFVIKQ